MDDMLAVGSVDFSDDFFANLTRCWPKMVRVFICLNYIVSAGLFIDTFFF